MKIIFIFSFLILFSKESLSQQVNLVNNGENLARKIAVRLKDSLNLSDAEMNNIYEINLSLHQQKMQVRKLYNSRDTLTAKTQSIEFSRDSLYLKILSPEKFALYKLKKRYLVSNNP